MKRNSTRANVFLWQLGFILLLACGCWPGDNTVEISVAVDFGPVNRATVERTIAVPQRSTVFDALRNAFSVVTSRR